MPLRPVVKRIANWVGLTLVLPFGAICRIEERLGGTGWFRFCGQLFAVVPGLPGVVLRRCFYRLTLQRCSLHCHIGFGTLIHHRATEIEDHVYLGDYVLAGMVHVCSGTLIGSRVSLLSGSHQHVLQPDGHWSPTERVNLRKITIQEDVWIGEGAIVMADVAQRSMIAAGAVVASAVPGGVLVAGNPLRFVRYLERPAVPVETASGAAAEPMPAVREPLR